MVAARPSPTEAASVRVSAGDVVTFWIRERGETVGLIRLLDVDDLDVGSPLFDLRIAQGHRRRGLGRQAVRWLTDHLFTTHDLLHRIEATTRDDNVAMQAVFAHCGYRLEGRLLEAWLNADGTRADTLIYGILRGEWVGLRWRS
jgi:RimJ/RimL family protein N-acetyltransferase